MPGNTMKNSQHDIEKAYVSPYDKFFYKFDATHERSASQLKEFIKHQRIFMLRDNPEAGEIKSEIWEEF